MSKPAILVTGGAKRVGAEIARHFAGVGWHVVVHYRKSSEEAHQLASSLPSAEIVQCDLADGEAAVRMVDNLAKRLPNWRLLVSSAAVFEPDTAMALDPAINERAMQVNARASTRMAQAYLANATAEGGRRVIQFTDQKLRNPNPDFFSYTMSKHAAHASVAMLAMGAARPHDRVYGLAPGAILPSHDQSEAEAEVSHRMNLLGRRTDVSEVAAACLFLSHGWLASGQTLFVDSGQHLCAQPRDVIYLARETQAS